MKRKIFFGANAAVTIALVIGIVCALYYVVERHPLRKDFTQNKTQTLSDKTVKILKGLDTQVEAVAFLEAGSQAESMVGDLLKEYERRSKNFSYRVIDPSQKPAEAQRYGATEFGVMFIAGGRRKNAPLQDMFSYSTVNPYEQQQKPPDFIGEQALTSALISVTSGERKTICFTEGHGERDINGQGDGDYAGVRVLLEGDNYLAKTINIAIEKMVPADCSAVVMPGPARFIAKTELDALKSYMDRGGSAMFMLDPLVNTGAETLLAEWGVRVGDDIVIDKGRFFGQDPLTPVPELVYSDITKALMNSKLTVSLPGARSVTESDRKPAGVELMPLLQTSPESWAETDLKTPAAELDEGKDKKGPFTLAIAVLKPAGASGGAQSAETRIIAVGDSDFASNIMTSGAVKIMAGGAGNADLFVNMVNWLAGEEKLISIGPKPADIRPLSITGPQRLRLFTVYVFVIPVLIILLGAAIWHRRRTR
ncbi:MAG: GldG family protein [bacterium]